MLVQWTTLGSPLKEKSDTRRMAGQHANEKMRENLRLASVVKLQANGPSVMLDTQQRSCKPRQPRV